MECCICTDIIDLPDRSTAYCWVDPDSIPCVAHFDCLVRIGEPHLNPGHARRWS